MSKYLTFMLGNEEYGVPIDTVKEIIGAASQEIHDVPECPMYSKGVINLRDQVIPIICMRAKFSMEDIEFTDKTCIVILEHGDGLMGITVDAVSEVRQVNDDNIEPPPDFGVSIDKCSISGMYKTDNTVCILLDTAKVLKA